MGPESLRHFKRTYREALKRQIMSGNTTRAGLISCQCVYDRRYRSYETKPLPESNAVIVYMMDVSGSMGERKNAWCA